MKSIDEILFEELENNNNVVFSASDEELVQRAVSSANVQHGSKDLIALGMASIWVVFASLFMKILTPIFKSMAQSRNK